MPDKDVNPKPGSSFGSTPPSSRWDTDPGVSADDMPHISHPRTTLNISRRMETGCGYLYVHILYLKEDPDFAPYALFANFGKAGSCTLCQVEALTRCITAGLKRGVPAKVFIRQLKGIRCPQPVWQDGVEMSSCLHAIGAALEGYMNHLDNDTIAKYVKGELNDTDE